jgi:hypothetical protein
MGDRSLCRRERLCLLCAEEALQVSMCVEST